MQDCCHVLMISTAFHFDRHRQTTNGTFPGHVVPNIHGAKWNIVNMTLFEQDRLWLAKHRFKQESIDVGLSCLKKGWGKELGRPGTDSD